MTIGFLPWLRRRSLFYVEYYGVRVFGEAFDPAFNAYAGLADAAVGDFRSHGGVLVDEHTPGIQAVRYFQRLVNIAAPNGSSKTIRAVISFAHRFVDIRVANQRKCWAELLLSN